MPSLREQVRARGNDCCEYCQLPQAFSTLPHELDHIRARKHHGATSLDNLCWACAGCNAAKGPNLTGCDPATGEIAALFNPRNQSWSDHFVWDGPVLVGKTATARATIDVLQVNAPGRMEHRRLLRLAGALPLRS
jgi:hypothetical protein